MSARITGIAGEMKRIKAHIKDEVKQVKIQAAAGIRAGLSAGMSATPVFSGEAVRNFKVGVGAVPAGASPPIGGRIPWPPSGPIPADVANEGRRGANQAAANAQANGVVKTFINSRQLPSAIYLANTSDIADLIENGSAPTAARSRYPGGVSIIMKQAIIAGSGGAIR